MTLDSSSFEEGLALGLLGRAVHASGTRSLDGMAELTFYDTLVAIAAAEGARLRQAWVIDREVPPPGWRGAERVDMVVSRMRAGQEVWIYAAELKWWRSRKDGNASNRRRDLVVDFMRAAAAVGFIGVEKAAYVVLVTTETAWKNTAYVSKGNDRTVCSKLQSKTNESWSLTALAKAPSIRGAVSQLRSSVPLTSTFHTKLVKEVTAPIGGPHAPLSVRVWEVRKPQKSIQFDATALTKLFGEPKKKDPPVAAPDMAPVPPVARPPAVNDGAPNPAPAGQNNGDGQDPAEGDA